MDQDDKDYLNNKDYQDDQDGQDYLNNKDYQDDQDGQDDQYDQQD